MQERDDSLPPFVLPGEHTYVTKYDTAKLYNIVFRATEGRLGGGALRDCIVATDTMLRGRLVRIYGKVLFFLRLQLRESPLKFLYVAYVNWFRQHEGDTRHIMRSHPPAHTIVDRAIPISSIVCKAALIPQSAAGIKCAVVELLWCVSHSLRACAPHSFYAECAGNLRNTKLRTSFRRFPSATPPRLPPRCPTSFPSPSSCGSSSCLRTPTCSTRPPSVLM